MEGWVTIRTFVYPCENYVLRSLLEAEGIPTFLKDEEIVSACILLSNAVGGVKLQVPGTEAERAVEILYRSGYAGETPYAPSRKESFPRDYRLKCPYCGSDNVIKASKASAAVWLGILFVNVPVPILNYSRHCFDCLREWKIKR